MSRSVVSVPRMTVVMIAMAAAQLGSNTAGAEVTSLASTGFEVRQQLRVAATSAAVYAALLTPSRWWDSKHTYSGDASRLTLDAKAGGCWCEALPDGGSVQHLTVVYVAPGKALRLRGALGPLQSMGLEGSLTISVAQAHAAATAGGGTDLTVTYAVGGYSKDGFETLSKTVDGVLALQVARLQRLAETGSAESTAPR